MNCILKSITDNFINYYQLQFAAIEFLICIGLIAIAVIEFCTVDMPWHKANNRKGETRHKQEQKETELRA